MRDCALPLQPFRLTSDTDTKRGWTSQAHIRSSESYSRTWRARDSGLLNGEGIDGDLVAVAAGEEADAAGGEGGVG
jgi:hypothetical protein